MTPEDFKKHFQECMKHGLCPVCNIKLKKNGKDTHSKQKRIICEKITKERLGIRLNKIKVGDKIYDVNIRPAKPDEVKA